MAWLLIIISVVLVWVASLCKTRQASFSPSKTVFLNNGEALQKRNVLLVIAHPDDESMFFSPTITFLNSRGHNLHLLCMSTGNADGMGNIRKEELYQASAILKVPLQQVKILDHPDFQDGFGKVWNHALLAKIIEEEVISHAIDTAIAIILTCIEGYGCSYMILQREILKHGNLSVQTYYASIVDQLISGCPSYLPCVTQVKICIACLTRILIKAF
ncbi:probable N-acetylglucosaminyl-phosphatidylinositol de-N-acetylase isoform X5 [Vitis riparia]|uniref:probable N-acetylglucosaminyl-phosphatidylinositol de-N-acetylase isoform X5 n=1 Tax=Vitis riparia TaxID=96939 RepID=UPI00155AB1FD|nr:probable N-acetylglucosaminyl-phosphatidylinositol de-N-acetylase isoform X5 [Vitis riparia]